jgi:hypothetical protein
MSTAKVEDSVGDTTIAVTEPTPSPGDIHQCLIAIARTLKNTEYAIIGGAAMMALGSELRTTHDIDILVKTGTTSLIKNRLSADPMFQLNRRTRHLTYHPQMNEKQIPIDISTDVLANIPEKEIGPAISTQSGLRIVHPSTLLNYKISTAYGRSTLTKNKRTGWMCIFWPLGMS